MDFPQRVNGWALYAHPCFQETYDALVAEVETLKGKDPENYQRKAATKLLAVVHKVIEEHITVNPSSPAFRHGKSLGSGKNGYTDLMVDGAPSPHQSDTTLRWLIDRLRS